MTEPLDLSHVTCGLMPAIAEALERAWAAKEKRVEILVRQGIREEILSAFGSNPRWKLIFGNGTALLPAFGDESPERLVFTRSEDAEKPRLEYF